MACEHQHCYSTTPRSKKYRKVLWWAFGINALMFMIEMIGGIKAGSVSLISDSLDFFGDSANYLISLLVLDKTLRLRAKASILKAGTMGFFGIWIIFTTLYKLLLGEVPNYHEMGVIGFLAFLANIFVAILLYAFREGDSNMRSVWLCSRNDAIGNLAIIVAAVAVFYMESNLPDLIVAFFMSYLAIKASWLIYQQAKQELLGQ